MFQDNGEMSNLKEELNSLTSEIAAKDKKLQANNKTLAVLKAEVDRLRPIAETVTVFEAQVGF